MLSEDLTSKLFEFKSYLPIFIQWNPVTNVPTFPLPTETVSDGTLYEVTCDADLIIDNNEFNLKKHDLVVRVDGKWEHVNMLKRNRLRFELWCDINKKGSSKMKYDVIGNVYTNVTMQNRWEIWQAALSTTISG